MAFPHYAALGKQFLTLRFQNWLFHVIPYDPAWFCVEEIQKHSFSIKTIIFIEKADLDQNKNSNSCKKEILWYGPLEGRLEGPMSSGPPPPPLWKPVAALALSFVFSAAAGPEPGLSQSLCFKMNVPVSTRYCCWTNSRMTWAHMAHTGPYCWRH